MAKVIMIQATKAKIINCLYVVLVYVTILLWACE